MSEINKRIEALEAELQKLKNEVKPKFEVGKWYKLKESTGNAIACYQGIKSGFGISGEMWFNNDNWTFPDEPENWIPATHQEVEEALIKEAKKRGFKEGVRFKSNTPNVYGDTNHTMTDYVKFDFTENGLFSGKGWIFKDGVWAEIVKDEPIKIGGYSVVIKKSSFEKDSHNDSFEIGCKQMFRHQIQTIYYIMKNNNFKKVSFDGVETDIETINKILAL